MGKCGTTTHINGQMQEFWTGKDIPGVLLTCILWNVRHVTCVLRTWKHFRWYILCMRTGFKCQMAADAPKRRQCTRTELVWNPCIVRVRWDYECSGFPLKKGYSSGLALDSIPCTMQAQRKSTWHCHFNARYYITHAFLPLLNLATK